MKFFNKPYKVKNEIIMEGYVLVYYEKFVEDRNLSIIECVNERLIEDVFKYMDYKIVNFDELEKYNYDYVFLHTKDIYDKLIKLGIKKDKIILLKLDPVYNVRTYKEILFKDKELMELKNKLELEKEKYFYQFDIRRRDKLKNLTPLIISNNCWAAYMYTLLGLEYIAPFIWTFIEEKKYVKMLENLDYYIDIEPEYSYEIALGHDLHPVCRLEDIDIHFFHHKTVKEAKNIYERRLKKFKEKLNKNNVFIYMILVPNDNYAPEEEYEMSCKKTIEKFDKLPYKNKLIISSYDFKIESNIYVPREEWRKIKGYYTVNTTRYIDVVKWFNGEKDYRLK